MTRIVVESCDQDPARKHALEVLDGACHPRFALVVVTPDEVSTGACPAPRQINRKS